MIKHCTAVILAGGESKRMGQDKAALIFEGQTLLARAEQHLLPLFEHVVVSVRKLRDDTALSQVLDHSESRAPMMGIVAALQFIKTDWIFVIGVDMPFVSAELIHFMAEQRQDHDAVVVEVGEKLQPLFAFYRKDTCLPMMQERIAQGKRGLIGLTSHIHTNILSQKDVQYYDSELQSFIDFDTQHEWKTYLKANAY